MADEGGAVPFISHELDEMMTQCDSLTVLRDGVIAGTLTKDEYDADVIKQLMVDRKVEGNYYRTTWTAMTARWCCGRTASPR